MYLNVKVKEKDGMEMDRTDSLVGNTDPAKKSRMLCRHIYLKKFIRHLLFQQICMVQKGGV
jgi:hypothetical protein